MVNKAGENSIVVSPGANSKVSIDDVNAASDLICSAGVLLMQLEIPIETVAHAIGLCRRAG